MDPWPKDVRLDQVSVPNGGAIIEVEGYDDKKPYKVASTSAGMPLIVFVAGACASKTLQVVYSDLIVPLEAAIEEGEVLRIKVTMTRQAALAAAR
ncbi:MAG: hypothetical protein WC773_04480 [Patescibacteria group bacterium]|jgi:hypothetical protein